MNRLRKFLLTSVAFVAILTLFAAPAYADLTINSATQFSTLDGSIDDADGLANGCFVYAGGNFTVSATGSILNNDPASPINNNAGNICANVTAGDILLQGAIKAENLVGGGSGGTIQLTASGDVTLQSTAVVSSSRVSGAGTGNGGNITITGTSASSEVTIDTGASIKSDASNGNSGTIAVTAPDGITINGTVSATGTGNASGGDITLTANGPTGDIIVGTGGVVKADTANNSGGDISMFANRYITIDGTVSSTASTGKGGAIWIDSGCTLTVGDNGIVSSAGKDPGADLVHLEGCDVFIYGLVQSTGPGHQPGNPANNTVVARQCFDADGGDESNATRPDKPMNSTACVEIWAGGDLVIDSTGTHNGQVNADTAQSGGTQGIGWIDLIARGDVTIIGDSTGPYAIHANQYLGTGHGGVIGVTSLTGDVTASGLAIQADNNLSTQGTAISGGSGGSITVQGEDDVTLTGAKLSAQGDSNASGGYGKGGQISLRAFTGLLDWQSGTGDVRPTGTAATLAAASRGTIAMQDCVAGLVNTTGTTFPNNGSPATTPTELADACGVDVTLASYVTLPPVCDSCSATPTPSPSPTPSETPSPTPTPTPEVRTTPDPTPTPTPTPSEEPSPSPSPSPTPSETPSPTPTPEVLITPEPSPSPSPSEEPSPTPTPVVEQQCEVEQECEPSPTPEEQASPDPSASPGVSAVDDPSDPGSTGGIAPTSFADTGALNTALPALFLFSLGFFALRRWQKLG